MKNRHNICVCRFFVVPLRQISKVSVMDKQIPHVTRDEYAQDFAQIIQIIEQNRSQAIQVINHASVLTAWQVGAYVSDKIKNASWGSKVVQQLTEYIHTQNPTLKGWSKRTIYKMVQFYETYSMTQFIERATSLKLLSKPSDEIEPISSAQIVPPAVTQIVSTPLIQNGFHSICATQNGTITVVVNAYWLDEPSVQQWFPSTKSN